MDNNGTLVAVTDFISGKHINAAKTLPGYELTLNRGDGTRIRRKFIPQNPYKRRVSDNEFSMTAKAAQKGDQIMWIIDPDVIDKSIAVRMYNSVLQKNPSGTALGWIAAE